MDAPSGISSTFLTTGRETMTGFCRCSVPLSVCFLVKREHEAAHGRQLYSTLETLQSSMSADETDSVDRSSFVKQSRSSPQSCKPRQLTLSHFTPLSQASQYFVVPKLARSTCPGADGDGNPSSAEMARAASSRRR